MDPKIEKRSPNPNPDPENKDVIQPPPDGMYDFDFDATPPTGIVPQVLTPISAELVLTEIPKGMKGVKVHSKSNSKEAKLEGPKK